MRKPEPGPNRHHFRIWIKMAIQSGLIDKLPPHYEPDGTQRPLRTDEHAHHLLAELRDPEASRRTLKEIIADVRQFKSWVESRQKDDRRRSLVESRPEERIIEMPPGRPRERRTTPIEDRDEPDEQIRRIPIPSCTRCGTNGSDSLES